MTKFFLTTGEVSFQRAERAGEKVGGFAVRQTLLVANVDDGLFVGRKLGQRGAEVLLKIGLVRPGRHGGFVVGERGEGNLALAAAGVAEFIVGDAEEPGGETRAAFKTGEGAIDFEERFLREVVGPGGVATREVTQETPDGGLVPLHELTEREAVVVGDDAGDELGVRRDHVWGGRAESAGESLRGKSVERSALSRRATPMPPVM